MKNLKFRISAGLTLALWGLASGAYAQSDPAIVYVADYGKVSGSQRRKDLMVANTDGSNRCVIWSRTLASGSVFHEYPAWSPDLDGNSANGFQGCVVVYGKALTRSAAVLFLVDVVVTGGVAQGANIREVVGSDLDPAANGSVLHPEWSPDLDAITPGYQGKIVYRGQQPGGAGRVNTIEMSWNGVSVQPTYGPNTSFVLSNQAGYNPTWSPDGQRIAAAGAAAPIVVLDASTGIVTNALTGLPSAGFMEWSRTGSRIAYRSLNNHLYTVDVDLGVGSAQQVTFDSYDQRSPSWSPDDRFIVYQQYVSYATRNKDSIRRLDVATGVTSLLISQSNVNLGSPDWRRF